MSTLIADATMSALVRDALRAERQQLLMSSASDASAMASDWLQAIATDCDLLDEAFAAAASGLGISEVELRASWASRSDPERRLWIERSSASASGPVRASLQALLRALDVADKLDPVAELQELLTWLPRREQLVFGLAPSGPAAIRSLFAFALQHIHQPVIALIDQRVWGDAREQLDDRTRALLDAGRLPPLLTLAPLDNAERATLGDIPGATHLSSGDGAALAQLGAQRATQVTSGDGLGPVQHGAQRATQVTSSDGPGPVQHGAQRATQVTSGDGLGPVQHGAVGAGAPSQPVAAETAHAVRRALKELSADGARSAAEQRLFELLEAEPVTHGLFELNVRMPFTFGPSRAEVDFVCRELKLVLEVDGFHHFQRADAYRRDRRKDVLLQHQGYLVSRHLADDVHERSGEVMRAVCELVRRRRRSLRRESST